MSFQKTSLIRGSADEVWNHVTRPQGINDELFPLLRMTVPRALKGKTIDDVELGKPLCRSWVLLFGIIPFDYDDLVIKERDSGGLGGRRRFRETSSMLSIREWEHERTLRPVPGGCEVTDRVSFELGWPLARVPGMQCMVAGALRYLFNHRHSRLARRFNHRPRLPPAPATDNSARAPGDR
jgi:ligand-binding SRPBCC domain-containing protein